MKDPPVTRVNSAHRTPGWDLPLFSTSSGRFPSLILMTNLLYNLFDKLFLCLMFSEVTLTISNLDDVLQFIRHSIIQINIATSNDEVKNFHLHSHK